MSSDTSVFMIRHCKSKEVYLFWLRFAQQNGMVVSYCKSTHSFLCRSSDATIMLRPMYRKSYYYGIADEVFQLLKKELSISEFDQS